MTGDKRSKGIATAPKKHKKSSRALWKEPGPAVTRDRSPSPYPPPRGAPLPHPPRGALLPYPPRGAPLPYDHSMMIGMGYTQPSPFNSVDPHVSPRQGFAEAPPLTPGYDTPQGFSQLPTGSQRATSSGTPTATPSPTVSHHSSASTARFGANGLHQRGSSSEPDNRTTDENLPAGGVVAPVFGALCCQWAPDHRACGI
ncbi:uncharacterized protein LOC132043086 [Lycium ferocissimum]|uniref:uncharacterized protein LOC132043086 n=1 Tax=Lycium ferocissimum TaxID=112874 RepID=UPI00281599D9|nr:uncharacterized protein LOC132043086 [Lycium ferocissimum]